MKKLLIVLQVIVISCSSNNIEIDDENNNQVPEIIYPISKLNDYSAVNKKTSWYRTNISFDELYDVQSSKYNGFELKDNGDIVLYEAPYMPGKVNCCYYWNDLGQYIYSDLDGDGIKDLWAYHHKAPWPKNTNGLHLFVDDLATNNYDLQIGLTQVRKNVLSDFNNDGINEITLFSSGYDSYPFPGDSLAFFDVKNKKYNYLTDDIGYFHGGATGDIDLDGNEDIIAYSGGSAIIPTHPVFYKNKGSLNFELNNEIFLNFSDSDNYYTVELFDIDNDGYLDLFLGAKGVLLVIKNENGTFDRLKAVNIQSDINLEPMDIDFFDFDNDNVKDILVTNNINYNGYSLKLYNFSFQSFNEISSNYFDSTKFEGDNAWIKWIHIFDFDNDGDLDVVADGLFGEINPKQIGSNTYWKNTSGKFKRLPY